MNQQLTQEQMDQLKEQQERNTRYLDGSYQYTFTGHMIEAIITGLNSLPTKTNVHMLRDAIIENTKKQFEEKEAANTKPEAPAEVKVEEVKEE